MKKLISLLLALCLTCSLIPLAASADANHNKDHGNITHTQQTTKKKGDKDKHDKDKFDKDKHDKHKHDKDKKKKEEKKAALVHEPGQHTYNGYGYNTKYHWLQCACGCKISMESHVDPSSDDDDICTCGYQFSDNADLVTLWVDGCPGIKNFNKNVTEYKLNAYTYKDVKQIKIATRTFDSEAIVELPEDLTLKEGENKFEVKVTAENQKVTKIYTLIITKEAAK